MSKHTYTTKVNDEPLREFEYTATEKGSQTIQKIEELQGKGFGVYAEVVNPENWEKLTYEQKCSFYEANIVDVEIEAVYCRGRSDPKDEDILSLEEHPTIRQLHILGKNITSKSIGVVARLPLLTELQIYGEQFGDEIIDQIMVLDSLENLDLQGASISEDGKNRVRSHFNNVKLWL